MSIGLIYKNEYIFFDKLCPIKDLIQFVSKRNKFTTLFIRDCTLIFPQIIKKKMKTWEISVFAVKGVIYNFTLKISDTENENNDKWIKFKSIETFIPDLTREVGEYEIIPFWSNGGLMTDEKEKIIRKEKNSLSIKKNTYLLKNLIRMLSDNLEVLNLEKKWYNYTSISTLSKKTFDENFNSDGIRIYNDCKIDECLRVGYYGGRCEVFGNPYKNEKIFHYDFKNMYGNLMLENFPYGELTYKEGPEIKEIEEIGFYHVKVKSNLKLPVLPHKTKFFYKRYKIDAEELIFTNGEFEGLYFKEEIDYFKETGGKIIKVNYAYIYIDQKTKPIFKDFAETIMKYREEKNKKFWKSFLVSFYGRLGMQPIKTKTIFLKTREYWNKKKSLEILNEMWIDDFVIIEYRTEPQKVESLVECASIITARARIKLHKNMIEIEKNKGRLLYCDTDSIFAAFLEDVSGEKHKNITWEQTNIREAVFISVRNYSIKKRDGSWETKIAGIERNKFNYEEMERKFYSLYDNEIIFYSEKFSMFDAENWKFQRTLNLKNYTKRKFSNDKKKTSPWTVIEGEYE